MPEYEYVSDVQPRQLYMFSPITATLVSDWRSQRESILATMPPIGPDSSGPMVEDPRFGRSEGELIETGERLQQIVDVAVNDASPPMSDSIEFFRRKYEATHILRARYTREGKKATDEESSHDSYVRLAYLLARTLDGDALTPRNLRALNAVLKLNDRVSALLGSISAQCYPLIRVSIEIEKQFVSGLLEEGN